MDSQTTLNKILIALGMAEEVKINFEERKMAEGDVVFEAESFETGEAVFIMNEDGEKIPAPEGHYAMEDGNVMMVDDQGVIQAYAESPVEEEEAEGGEPKAEEETVEVEASEEDCKDCEGDVDLKEPCWEGYEQYGTKMVDGKEVPNCVPIDAEKEEEVEMSEEVVSEVTAEAKEPKKVVESTTTQTETYFAEQEKLKVEFASAKEQWATERAELETIKTQLMAEVDELKERLATEPSAQPLSHSVEGKSEDVRLYKHKSKHRTNTKDSVLSRLYK